MYQLAYSETQRDSVADARQRERALLQRCVDLLQKAKAAGHPSTATTEAVHFVARVWTALMDDLSAPRNELPADLRAGLISIGLWVLREVEAIRQQQSDNFDGLIEIIGIVRDGLGR